MYYVYEMQMPEEDRKLLESVAEKEGLSMNALFLKVLQELKDHPEDYYAWKKQFDQLPEEERRRLEQIRISCVYPVEDGETEEEARERMLRKAHQAFPFLDSPTTLPVISQQEFCDHIEDDDFFLVYGNPVVIRENSGTKLLATAFPMWERYMRIIGLGDEIDVIKRKCAEAYEQQEGKQEQIMTGFGEAHSAKNGREDDGL